MGSTTRLEVQPSGDSHLSEEIMRGGMSGRTCQGMRDQASTIININRIGPWTPLIRTFSMSAVRLGPVMTSESATRKLRSVCSLNFQKQVGHIGEDLFGCCQDDMNGWQQTDLAAGLRPCDRDNRSTFSDQILGARDRKLNLCDRVPQTRSVEGIFGLDIFDKKAHLRQAEPANLPRPPNACRSHAEKWRRFLMLKTG